jgi:hypothetical protein
MTPDKRTTIDKNMVPNHLSLLIPSLLFKSLVTMAHINYGKTARYSYNALLLFAFAIITNGASLLDQPE